MLTRDTFSERTSSETRHTELQKGVIKITCNCTFIFLSAKCEVTCDMETCKIVMFLAQSERTPESVTFDQDLGSGDSCGSRRSSPPVEFSSPFAPQIQIESLKLKFGALTPCFFKKANLPHNV